MEPFRHDSTHSSRSQSTSRRRDLSYTSASNQTLPKPSTGYDKYDFQYLQTRPEVNRSSDRASVRASSLQPDSRSYHRSSSTAFTRRSQHSPLRKRNLWPPQPFAEDEAASLRRESNSQILLRNVGKDEVQFRGTVDQEPMILDVQEAGNQNERRFTLSGSKSSETGILTPPTSEDERVRKARRKPSRLNIRDEDAVPELSRRTASPYSFSKPTAASSPRRVDSTSQPTPSYPYSSSPNQVASAQGSTRSPAQHESPRRSGSDRVYSYGNVQEMAIDDSGYASRPVSAKGRNITDRPLTDSPRMSAADLPAPQLAGNAPPIRRMNLDARRNTDTQNTLPNLARLNVEKSRRPTPLTVSDPLSNGYGTNTIPSGALQPQSAGPYTRSRDSSYASSRGPSPAGSTHNAATPPSRSPRVSADFSREGSMYGSKPASASSSRPASPSPRAPTESPRIPRNDMDWNALLAANAVHAARRSKPSSRLSAHIQQDSPDTPHRRTEVLSPTSGLPYPEDSSLMGGLHMPEEEQHAYYPHPRTSLASSPVHNFGSSVHSASPAMNPIPRTSTQAARPTLTRGYSAAPTAATAGEPRSAELRMPRGQETKQTEAFATTSDARKEIASLVKKGLPPCPRPEPVAGHDDWYTVSGATNIDFCPECIGTLFERTVYRPYFRRSLPRNLDDKVQCAFGSSWIRLAWLLTLQQHRTDLCLLKDLAEIEGTTEPCPGAVECLRSWYGLRDPDGRFVRDFHVCYGDVRKIERLLPTLAGIFVRLPQRASIEKRICAIRTDSNRFSAYLDALVATHERAITSRKGADSMPLINLVERKTRLRECTRDVMLVGGLWHFPAETPTMTVCEDCFESVVEPEIKKGSWLAKKFSRTVQPVYGEGIGSSCQLYSRRMRKVFQRAVEDEDIKYLTRKSKERREMELYLQDKYKDVMRQAKRLSWQGEVSDEEERRLTRDLEKISMEWKTRWE